jgi:hypothetical protein
MASEYYFTRQKATVGGSDANFFAVAILILDIAPHNASI